MLFGCKIFITNQFIGLIQTHRRFFMASLKLSHIYKVYENGHKAVNDFNIDIKDKEFIVFVGPSGCGKSTTLRMIAGLEDISAGDLFIGDTLVNDMEPKDRDIAMVFQSYALYPHMTVYENMAFGLRNRHMPEAQIKEKVLEAAKMLDIEDYLQRKPKAMSGGQRQRVALGRALVRDPKVFLLDEPLSNLDAKLRAQMRTEITKLHKRLATTFIYVTHDQVEAMTMGTRIVVMKLGYVQQIDTPMNLYNKPHNKFVAGFIGTPQMNFFDVRLDRKGDKVKVTFPEESVIELPYERVSKAPDKYLHGEEEVIFGIRPDHIALSEKPTGLTCRANVVEHLGNECIIYGELGAREESESISGGNRIIVKCVEGTPIEVGDVVNLAIDPTKIHLFDKESEITILEDVPLASSFQAKVAGEKMEFLGAKLAMPEALAEALAGRDSAIIDVPPSAVVPGKDYSLKVHEVEELDDGRRLAYLEVGDRYLFALVDAGVKAGQAYKFDLLNDKLTLRDEAREVVLAPIGEEEFLLGTFEKFEHKEGKERIIDFNYVINGVKVAAPQANGFKINAVEGNDCYKNTYKYGFDRERIVLADPTEGIHAVVEKILHYGNADYAVLNANEQRILARVDGDFAAAEVGIVLNGEDIAVYSIDIDMRVC